MSFSRSNELCDFLEEQYYLREIAKQDILDIFFKYDYNNNKYILDSSLISESKRKLTNIKLVRCGNYLQFYFYSKLHYETNKNMEKMSVDIKLPRTGSEATLTKPYALREIEEKNINRSKFSLQNLVKSNIEEFHTFITLTFKDNITDIKEANKKFHIWRRNLKRLKPDLKYICVPEFQKRGAVHYHLMTNIKYDDFKVLSKEERRIYKPGSGWNIGRDIKGWIYGHNMAKDITDVNVVGYLTKYMTKEIDNRLFGKHRYFYSQNLIKPEVLLLDLSTFQDYSMYSLLDIRYDFQEMTFCKKYQDNFGDDVMFVEYLVKE